MRARLIPVCLSASVLVVAGCSGSSGTGGGSVALTPACAAVRDRLPATVLDQQRNPGATGTQAPAGPSGGDQVGTYGDPAITVTCGVPDRGPTTDPCLTVNGIDWVYVDPPRQGAGDDPDAPDLVLTTYGRTPVVRVDLPASYGQSNASAALVDLAAAVDPLPSTGACIGDDPDAS